MGRRKVLRGFQKTAGKPRRDKQRKPAAPLGWTCKCGAKGPGDPVHGFAIHVGMAAKRIPLQIYGRESHCRFTVEIPVSLPPSEGHTVFCDSSADELKT